MNTLIKSRRRDTSERSRGDNTSRSQSKPTPIIGEDLLKAESSSEASDVVDNDIEQGRIYLEKHLFFCYKNTGR